MFRLTTMREAALPPSRVTVRSQPLQLRVDARKDQLLWVCVGRSPFCYDLLPIVESIHGWTEENNGKGLPFYFEIAAAAFQVVIPSNTTLRHLRNICQQVLCHSERECSFISVAMEGSTGNSLSSKKTSEDNDVNKSTADIATSSVFVSHAEIAWQQNRRQWIGDQSKKFKRMPKDPIIRYIILAKYLIELLVDLRNLQEMVDFLVDIWQDDGLYD
ncbi:hypothetical protein RHGRI_007765 [Rhododendron griersonianum]|uniref:Uncharacterized protein n=1 Tax=Rhododendron griersonianum TaxID=479676 RepID=A0AAV6KXX7_9ERIC|nr:hypothetical protein RHGRI_007765 [Rhododendron griersonianum]